MENSEEVIKRFGRYEIVAELGRGAMGVVYKARDPQIDRLVAVKTVSLWGQEPDEEKEFRMRFMNEAQAAGRLHHPGIVAVFDVGENPENQDPYIVLEYVQGETLNRILHQEKKLPLATALKFAEELAEALDYAHAQGVVHRDMKPANILITESGHAKIADFGIAKLNLAHFTVPGRVLGTPAYMAPEQLSGEGADGRSDLFSLGVILYAMVTGHSPFQGNSATTVCFKVANREPIAASALDMTLPPQLDTVIQRAIAKDPSERYQSGAEFAEDLRVLQQHYKPGSTTTSLQSVARAGTQSGSARTEKSLPARSLAGLALIEKLVGYVLYKAPVRNLILFAATIVLLVIIGAQTKLLVISPKVGMNSASAVLSPPPSVVPDPTSGSANQAAPPAPTQPVPAGTAAASPVKPRSQKAHPAKQIVVPECTLELGVQHQFKDATLYVWIDDKLAMTMPLHGGAQKKLVVFGGIRGVESETMKVPAGKHVLRVRALSADRATDFSRTVSADFIGGDDKSLQVTFDRHNLRLAWQ